MLKVKSHSNLTSPCSKTNDSFSAAQLIEIEDENLQRGFNGGYFLPHKSMSVTVVNLSGERPTRSRGTINEVDIHRGIAWVKFEGYAEPDPDPITACYKCGTTYLNPQSLTQHIKRCRGTSANLQSNALTFTQREMQLATSAKEGPYSLQNNTYVGEAYQQQLCMPPSLAEMARLHRIEQERTDNEERSDDYAKYIE